MSYANTIYIDVIGVARIRGTTLLETVGKWHLVKTVKEVDYIYVTYNYLISIYIHKYV